MVTHAHFNVNGHPMNIPSYLVKPGDKISVRESSRKLEYWTRLTADKESPSTPQWLMADRNGLVTEVRVLPKRDEIEVLVKEQLVVEYYSR